MDREKFKEEFKRELAFFNMITSRDLEKGYTINQVEDELVKFTSSFYGSRIDFDVFAVKKCYFIATYSRQIIKGELEENLFNELCDNIEEEKRIRGL